MDTPPNACRTQPKVMASKISTNSKKTIIAEQKTCFIALNPFIFHLKTDLLYHRHVFSSRSLVLCRRGTMSCFPKHILPALLPPASNRFRQTGRESDRPTDKLLRRALLVTPRAFRVTSQNLLNMQKAARFMQRAAFSFMRFFTPFQASDCRSSPPFHRRDRTVPCSPSL